MMQEKEVSETIEKEKHERKSCPRCGDAFICKVGDVANCQCSEVLLSDKAIEFLDGTYYDCLCKKCLADINRLIRLKETHFFPTQRETLIEDLHYYKEKGSMVFTEFYHILRGKCCHNGCRHCAYGYKK